MEQTMSSLKFSILKTLEMHGLKTVDQIFYTKQEWAKRARFHGDFGT